MTQPTTRPTALSQPSQREQALNLIDFLSAYEAQRNPPVRRTDEHGMFRLAEAALPTHPAVRLNPSSAEIWLSVDFLDLPPAPQPPEEVVTLLVDGGTISATREPVIVPMPPLAVDTDHRAVDVHAADGADLAEAERAERDWLQHTAPAREWIDDIWRPWNQAWHEANAIKQLHRTLFEQRERLAIDRESVELVWGFGRLRWSCPHEADQSATSVDHPMLTVPVEVSVDPRTQRIDVTAVGAPEVESRFLLGLDLNDRVGYTAIRHSLTADPIDPWAAAERDDLLRRLVRAVDDHGTLSAGPATDPRTNPPADPSSVDRVSTSAIVDTSWTIFLRRRMPDSEGFLQTMRDLYRDDQEVIPPPLRAILSNEDFAASTTENLFPASHFTEESTAAAGLEAEPLLLPLPANEQQQRILRLAQRHPGVAVQGPPGTGKSHTIANLISHYVAYGRRVLVVAEKEQALKVLAEKVPEEIRDLTVSVLGADEEGRRRLGSSITQIQTRVGQVDPALADARITELTAHIDRLDRKYAEINAQLLTTRQAEVAEQPGPWLAGSPATPQAAAGWVADRQNDLAYIPDRLRPADAAPLTADELAELVDLIRTVGTQEAHQAGDTLPDRQALPSAAEFEQLVQRRDALDPQALAARKVIRDHDAARPEAREDLEALALDLRRESDWRRHIATGWLGTVVHQYGDPLLAREWTAFADDLRATREQVLTLRARLRAHAVRLPVPPSPELKSGLEDALTRLAGGGKLGMFARDAKRAVEACSVDGHPPATSDGVQLCLDAIEIERLRHRLANQWANQAGLIGAPPLSGFPEETVGPRLDEIATTQQAHQRWLELSERLHRNGFAAPGHPEPAALQAAAAQCTDAAAWAEQRSIDDQIDSLRQQLMQGAAGHRPSAFWLQLADAAQVHDTAGWRTHLDRLQELERISVPAARLTALLERLAAAAPVWANSISADPAAARDPADLTAAWQWRQLETWLDEIAALPSPATLQARLEQVSDDRRRAVTELVAERAWRRLADNLGRTERQALQSYVAAVTRYGKTGGKFAHRWIAEMRAALDDAKTAVPVWIMPTNRALTSFRPTAVPPFDVLIVDEASQIGFEALPLLSLAKSTIVVGDDKQTSPEHVGLDRQRIFDLMDDYLREIPRYKTVFDPDRSLYDLATLRFSHPVMLTEHFRCLPQIIEFSNQIAYDGKIIPLRDKAPRLGWEPLRLIHVQDGYRSGPVNQPEVDAVVGLIERLHTDPDYDDMTFGVISLLGTEQSKRIWESLYERLGPEVLQQRQIRCGEPANFQGDERDVMVLSTVAAIDPSISSTGSSTRSGTRYGAMTSTAALRRMNVAASRARNQMWVVTSVGAAALPNGDLRAELIRHCSEPSMSEEQRGDVLAACESEFERRVVKELLNRGYRVDAQHRVGNYRLDIVVSGPDRRLAIECDGDRWHGEDAWERDRARQQVLERAGWTFERIRGSSFFRHREAAMEPVWQRLAELGIPTESEWPADTRPISTPVSIGPDVDHDENPLRAIDLAADQRRQHVESMHDPAPNEERSRAPHVESMHDPAPNEERSQAPYVERPGLVPVALRDEPDGTPAPAESVPEPWTPPAWYLALEREPPLGQH